MSSGSEKGHEFLELTRSIKKVCTMVSISRRVCLSSNKSSEGSNERVCGEI